VKQLSIIIRRLPALLTMLVIVSMLIFSITYLIPGDPAAAIAGETASPDDIARVRTELGLDQPFLSQYVDWMSGVLQGDLGTSIQDGRSVTSIIAARAPATFSLGLAAIVIALLVGVPLGIAAATKVNSLRDRAAVVAASAGVAVPNYWLGMLLVTVFAVQLGWFPPTGYVGFSENPAEWLRHITLPALALGLSASAELARQTRASLSHVLTLDYVRTARMKGLPSRFVVGKHAFKNAAGPVVTSLGLQATVLLGGTVIVERVFGIPGLGNTALVAVSARDIPVIQGIVLVTTLIAVVVNLAVDLTYTYLNPRIAIS
jgi:peptide/nickel transport system permease protein